MARTLTNSVITQLEQQAVSPFFAVKIAFPSGTLRLWTGLGDLTISSETYSGTGNFLGVSNLSETEELKASGLELTLSGIPSSLLGTMLTDNYQGSLVTVFFGFLSEADTGFSVVSDPFIIFQGLSETLELSEGSETLTAKMKVESRLIAIEESRARRYTNEDQQISHSDATSLRFVTGLQDKEIIWGKGS